MYYTIRLICSPYLEQTDLVLDDSGLEFLIKERFDRFSMLS